MITISDGGRRHGRREFLRVGGLALGGLSLSSMLASRFAAGAAGDVVRDKSVIFLFMQGGPSQLETFDPKMTAPAGVRSATGETATAIPGVTFGGTFGKIAKLADKVSIVRSYATGDGIHDIKPIVCRDTLGANMGSLYTRVAGMNHPRNGMPRNAVLMPPAVDETTKPTNMSFGKYDATGVLGDAFAPFTPGQGGQFQSDMQLNLARGRLDDRRALLAGLDRLRRTVDATGGIEGMDVFQEQAFHTIVGGVADAFNLAKEDPRVVERYDTSPLVRPEAINKNLNNYNYYVDHGKSLGKLLLLARRLCEAGCGFVTITTNFVWDNHADVNNAGVREGMHYCGLPFDHAVSAFLEDIEARGLSDRILLVCSGEMGRTPRINSKGGRDHWGGLAPLLLAGGGLQMGRVIGQSTRDAGEPLTRPWDIKNLVATIMHTLVDTGELRLRRDVPTEVARTILANEPIGELL